MRPRSYLFSLFLPLLAACGSTTGGESPPEDLEPDITGPGGAATGGAADSAGGAGTGSRGATGGASSQTGGSTSGGGTGTTSCPPGTSGRTCAPCDAGTYCAGDEVPPVGCGDDTLDDDDDPSTPCISKTTCPPGTFVSDSGSATSDRVCEACAAESFSSVANAPACGAWSTCSPGEFETRTPDFVNDRECGRCPAETFDDDGDPTTACVPKTACAPGFFVESDSGAAADRACAPCAPGSFSLTLNSSLCSAHTSCPSGTRVETEPTPTSDRSCVACEATTFSAAENSVACLPMTVCAPGTFVETPGTSATDRQCASCPLGMITFASNSTACEAIVPMSVAVGGAHTCAALSDGSVRCFGSNADGQLGVPGVASLGDDEDASLVPPVSLGARASRIALGAQHSCALLTEGTIRCWGRNNYGQLGLGNTTTVGDDEEPSNVSTVSLGRPAVFVAAGANHSCAILDDGSVRCWGRNNFGQLGLGNTTTIGDNEVPSSWNVVELGGTAVELALGAEHTCALLADGNVRCWGRNNFGQLGLGNTTTIGNDEVPAGYSVALAETATSIGAGQNHSCAVLASGALRCWGRNNYGQLGRANTTQIGDSEAVTSVPTIDLGGSALRVTGGTTHTCAILSGGAVRCFGRSNLGQLGYGNTQTVGDNEHPSFVSPVGLGESALVLTSSFDHTCALTASREMRCFGAGASGQLGLGTTVNVGDGELPSSVSPVSFYP